MRVLTEEEAAKRLGTIGKVWYPENFFDSQGRREEYCYLCLNAVNMGLTDVSILSTRFLWLLSVDLSGNELDNSSVCRLSKLTGLVSLKVNRNLFEDPYLPPVKRLQNLEMNGNSIRSLHRIYHPDLKFLDLGRNAVDSVDPRDSNHLNKLETLNLRNNFLQTTDGIRFSSLTELYLAENRIRDLGEGTKELVNLRFLHLRGNPLSDLSGFHPDNDKINYLNLRECDVRDPAEIEKLRVLKGLRTLVLRGNPFEENLDPEGRDEFRIRVLAVLPDLTRIDKREVSPDERIESKQNEFSSL